MAGKLTLTTAQINDSATATNNFVLKADNAGGVKLSRGNDGATTQDVWTVDANGRVAMPQTVVAFSASRSTAQSIPNGTVVKIQLNTEEFDIGGFFDSTTNYRFQPTVAGYYQMSGGVAFSTVVSSVVAELYKNGTVYRKLGSQGQLAGSSGSCLVYLNGSSDYVELFGYQLSGAALDTVSAGTFFQGILIAKA